MAEHLLDDGEDVWVLDPVELPAADAACGDDTGGAQLGQLLAGRRNARAGELGQCRDVEFGGGEQPDEVRPGRDGEQVEGQGGCFELVHPPADRSAKSGMLIYVAQSIAGAVGRG